jgi:hypothetical protein
MRGVKNHHAQHLFCTLQTIFATAYQRASFRTLLSLFLRGNGQPYLRHSHGKSASALSRFVNHYDYSSSSLMRLTRQAAVNSLLAHVQQRRGRRPTLLVMIDLTTLEKTGRFAELGLIRVLHKKRGLHVVVMYLQVGKLRVPWGLRVWRGKGTASVSVLGLRLVASLPWQLTSRFRVLVLADGGFGTTPFLEGIHALGFDAVVGMRQDRLLTDNRSIKYVRSGERVTLQGLSFPVTVGRYYLTRHGQREIRIVVTTLNISGHLVSRWGKRRWRIEAFFKTTKSRFGLARFGQGTTRGVYRFLLFSLLAFVLSQWGTWHLPKHVFPDWRAIALDVRASLMPELVLDELQAQMDTLRPYLEAARRLQET